MKTVLVHERAIPPGDETAASEPSAAALPAERVLPQLRLGGIAAVWAAAALPMALLAWVVAPAVADHLSGPGALSRALIMTLTAGLVWQFVLVIGLIAREQGSLRWSVLKDALWLRAPRAPRTGRRGGRAWLILLPLVVVFGAEELLPVLSHPASRDLGEFLGSHAGHTLLGGSWGWFAILATLLVFNTVLGEELLFRGYLLPRMNGVFGRRDWLANGVLFALYHLHEPWVIPAPLLLPVEAYGTKRYRSALVGIAVHSTQSLLFLALALPTVVNG
jgi:membrane protease YdiL (CAAX protease family)